jgi:RimJ/RimL family protein N-acetyltransferase
VDRQPHLVGERIEVRPLREGDYAALYEVASDPLLWEQHFEPDRWREDVFRRFFDAQLASGGGLAVIDRRDGRIVGTSRYHDYDPEASEVEIGWTFLARTHWGGETNGELKRLMLEHAFGSVERVYFLVTPENLRSRRAVEKLGAVEAGVLRGAVLYELRKG